MVTRPVGEHLNIARIPGAELDDSPYASFVIASFVKSLHLGPSSIRRAVLQPGCVVLIATPAEGEPVYLGWLAAVPTGNRIVCAFTKAAYRASPEQRHGGAEDGFRIASSLAIAAGIDFSRPVVCGFFTRAARAIRAKVGNPYNLREDA